MHFRGVPTKSPPLSMSDQDAVFTLPALDMVLWHGVPFRLLYICSTLRQSASNTQTYVGTSTIQETAYEHMPPQLHDVNPAKTYHRNIQTPSCGTGRSNNTCVHKVSIKQYSVIISISTQTDQKLESHRCVMLVHL